MLELARIGVRLDHIQLIFKRRSTASCERVTNSGRFPVEFFSEWRCEWRRRYQPV